MLFGRRAKKAARGEFARRVRRKLRGFCKALMPEVAAACPRIRIRELPRPHRRALWRGAARLEAVPRLAVARGVAGLPQPAGTALRTTAVDVAFVAVQRSVVAGGGEAGATADMARAVGVRLAGAGF